MKRIICLIFAGVLSFSQVMSADAPRMENVVISDLVYHGEEWKFHDLVYRGEPIEVTVLSYAETSLK